MPASMTHYQLGTLVLDKVPQSTRIMIESNRAMFDLGTQGPDLLFFYRPYRNNTVSNIGNALHGGRAQEFLTHIFQIRNLKDHALTSYLYGMCCHYALDRNAHPVVNQCAPTSVMHRVLESSFERIIKEQYHVEVRRCELLPYKHIHIGALHKVYPEVTKTQLKEAVLELHYTNCLLEHRSIMRCLDGIMQKNGAFTSLCIPREVEDMNAWLLLEPFEVAIEDATHLIGLYSDLTTNLAAFQCETPHDFEGVS